MRATAALRRVARLAPPRAAPRAPTADVRAILRKRAFGGVLAALRQKISSRVRAPAFAGATTGMRGGRNALGAPLEALQRPHATSYHLLTTFVPLTPTSEKHYPDCVALAPRASEKHQQQEILDTRACVLHG